MTDIENAEFLIDRHGPVMIIRLNRPQARNALTRTMMQGIGAAVIAAEADPSVRAVLLTGTGDRAFCSGMDLRAFAGGTDFGGSQETDAYGRLAKGQTTIPVVGAANGTAIGGGLELLLGSDVIIASAAAKFGFPEAKRGLFAAGGGTSIGTRIPLGIALELLLTGEFIDADRAYQIGLVNAVAAPDQVFDTALALAEKIAANAPLGLAATKELARLAVTDSDLAEQRLAKWQSIVFSSADAKEGAMAFVEKRSPNWQGR